MASIFSLFFSSTIILFTMKRRSTLFYKHNVYKHIYVEIRSNLSIFSGWVIRKYIWACLKNCAISAKVHHLMPTLMILKSPILFICTFKLGCDFDGYILRNTTEWLFLIFTMVSASWPHLCCNLATTMVYSLSIMYSSN